MMILRVIVGIFEILIGFAESIFRTIVGILAIIRVRLHRNFDYRLWLKRDLADCDSILELGCGSNSPILQIGYGQKTDCVDIFQPYIEMHNRKGNYKNCWLQDILTYDLPAKAYDAVVITDVMEHLPRETVLKLDLFKRMEKCARKKVIIFAPNGYIENDEVDGDPYQAHVSAWEPADYIKRGYSVKGATGLRYILGKASRPRFHPYSIFEIIAMLSKPYIFNNPKIAWHSYAVKVV